MVDLADTEPACDPGGDEVDGPSSGSLLSPILRFYRDKFSGLGYVSDQYCTRLSCDKSHNM